MHGTMNMEYFSFTSTWM